MKDAEKIHGVTAAGEYDHLIGSIVPGQSLLISTTLEYLPDNPGRILELGCGTGILTEQILERFPGAEITGIDLSPDMLRVASEKPGLRNVHFIAGDLRDAWPAGPYDAIVTSLCIHHISAAERVTVVKRAYKALSRGGRFVCGDIFLGESGREEEIFLEYWLKGMKKAGIPDDVIRGMNAARNERRPELRPVSWFRTILLETGFSPVIIPFTAGFAGLVVGFMPE